MKLYFEQRAVSGPGNTEGIAADMMRHLYTRQYLGKTLVVCEQPVALLSTARKQWLKLSRSLQRQRSSTINADKILKYTHGIAHMQRLRFAPKPPLEHPNTDVFFLIPEQLQPFPAQCISLYLTCPLDEKLAKQILDSLPADALIVDYTKMIKWSALGLESKEHLEKRVAEEWKQVTQFLREYGIRISGLQKNDLYSVDAMDDALDILLAVSHRFLTVAGSFQHILELARPMRMPKTQREKYDSFMLLAHRVQALTPGAFSQQFLQVYNEDDAFFLYDHGQELLLAFGETLEESHARHVRAGRKYLAEALAKRLYSNRSFQTTR
ncbi:MAG TPA: hypothetical protein VFB59_00015 [Candidatus Saccharimonadales bacterium]|nr:hypothetical protein [Candidatus Saccharimonadales bacterium]